MGIGESWGVEERPHNTTDTSRIVPVSKSRDSARRYVADAIGVLAELVVRLGGRRRDSLPMPVLAFGAA